MKQLFFIKILISKFLFLIIFIFCFTLNSKSQILEDVKGMDTWDRIYFGGNVSLEFGSKTIIDFSPLVGYHITDRLSAGIGLTYLYYKDNQYDFSTNIYGGRIFARFGITENLFAHAENEMLSLESKVFANYGTLHDGNRFWVDNFLVGGGYSQEMWDGSSAYVMVLFNLNETEYSLYGNPLIRIGFNIGM